MKDELSFQTALALKEAGFPQPDPQPGQIWYDGALKVMVRRGKDVVLTYMSGAELYKFSDSIFPVFAPSVADLLRELPNLSLSFAMGVFLVYGGGVSSCRENAAELLAAAWLEKNKKQ